MKTVILAAGLLLVTAAPALADAVSICEAQAKAGKIRSFTAVAKCLNKQEAAMMRARTRHHDLVKWSESQRLVIAEQADRGQITPTEASARWDEVIVAFNTEIQKRDRPVQQAPAVVVQQQQKAVTFCNTLGFSTVCF